MKAVEASIHALFPSNGNGGVQAGVQVLKNNKSALRFDSNMSRNCVNCSLCHGLINRLREIRIQALLQVRDDLKQHWILYFYSDKEQIRPKFVAVFRTVSTRINDPMA